MSTAYLGIGSNIDARRNIRSAVRTLSETFSASDFSPVYRCPAFGFKGNDFLNLAARVETDLSPLALKHWLVDLEDDHGRDRTVSSFSDRTLDVDILLYDDLCMISPALELPRGEILEAAYVLKPLADLAPDLQHPVEKLTMRELWQRFPAEEKTIEIDV